LGGRGRRIEKFKAALGYTVRSCLRNNNGSWVWWFSPVIPVTLEVEIWKILVQGQLGQKVSKTLILIS
jgi:hypothetical protein